MRLVEILTSNQLVIELYGMKVNFSDDVKFISETHLFFKETHVGISRHRTILENIHDLVSQIAWFIEYEFDPDEDIAQLKEQAQKDMRTIDEIKKEIP